MSKIRAITIACLFILLSACQPGGGKDIVGRWEFTDGHLNIAYEFYDDGTAWQMYSLNLFEPMPGYFTYTYDPVSGVMNITIPGREKGDTWQITFESNNKIVIDDGHVKKPMEFIRKPLPELPPGARARLGGALLGKDFAFVEAEKLNPGWEKEFGEYTAVYLTNVVVTVGVDVAVEEWLVTLQIEGEEGKSFYLLRKESERWGVIQLIKKD